MTCPQCGRDNLPGAKFCAGCGATLDVGSQIAPQPAPEQFSKFNGSSGGDIEHDIEHKPSYALAVLKLKPGQSVTAETGAMVTMSPNVTIQTASRGGILKGLKRAALGGESFFINTFTAENGTGEISLAPKLPGDVIHLPLNGGLFIQSGSFLACSTSINIDTKWGGAKTFFSGEGLFLLKAQGNGSLFLSSYGGIHMKVLSGGEKYIIDTQHMVAFSDSVQYKVTRVGNWKSTFLSGEGLVAEYSGPGTIYFQTRSLDAFLSLIAPQINRKGGGAENRSGCLGAILGATVGAIFSRNN